MDALGFSSSAPITLRPAISLPSDLSAVLREGSVVAGEVLQTLDGGTLLLGIGGHRVPAESHVELPAGRRFLFQVYANGGRLELRVLERASATQSALLDALRSVAGSERPMAELLAALSAELGLAVARGVALGESARTLLASIAGRAFRPGSDAAELKQLLEASGLRFEARLADVALRNAGARDAGEVGRELKQLFLDALDGELASRPTGAAWPGAGASEPFEQALRRAIAQILAPEGGDLELALSRWLAGSAKDGPVRDPLQLVRLALARVAGSEQRESALRELDRSGMASLGREARTLLVRALLGLAERRSSSAMRGDTLLRGLDDDLKLQLLRAWSELADVRPSAAREAIGRALASLEAQQLLNTAREWSHQALHWSVPVPDGDQSASAQLVFERHPEPAREDARESEREPAADEVQRVALAVDFSHTGPLRADLVVRSGALSVRLLAAREDVVAQLSSSLGELEQRLALGGRRVNLSLELAAPGAADLESESHDIGFLREHPVMDVSG